MGKNEFDRDLNIFGSDDEGSSGAEADIFGAGDVTDAVSSDEVDMFGDAADENADASTEGGASDTSADDTSSSSEGDGSESAGADSADGDDSSSDGKSDDELPEPDALDAEIASLFKQLEDEASSDNPNQNVMDDIIDELRMSAAQKDTQIAFLTKQVESLQNRVLESASRETDQAINQPLISKVEADPKLRAIIHLAGGSDEGQKQKLARILSDYYSELTGTDLSGLLETQQNDKAMAALGAGGSGNGGNINVRERESVPVSYDDSISSLW